MTFSITYDTSVVDGSMSVADYLTDWAMRYCDFSTTCEDDMDDSGGGYWGVSCDGGYTMDYSIASTWNGSTGFALDGQWVYDPDIDMLFSYLNDISFGEGICFDSASGYDFASLEVTFDGLADLLTDNYSVISGLMGGDVCALLEQLENAGIDTSASLDCYAPMQDIEPYADVVGLPEAPDTLLAA